MQKEVLLNHLLTKTGILLSEPRLDPWLARVLINELLWGKESLKTECKPAKTILSYEKQLRDVLRNARDVEALQPSSKAGKRVGIFLPMDVCCFYRDGPSLLEGISSRIEPLIYRVVVLLRESRIQIDGFDHTQQPNTF